MFYYYVSHKFGIPNCFFLYWEEEIGIPKFFGGFEKNKLEFQFFCLQLFLARMDQIWKNLKNGPERRSWSTSVGSRKWHQIKCLGRSWRSTDHHHHLCQRKVHILLLQCHQRHQCQLSRQNQPLLLPRNGLTIAYFWQVLLNIVMKATCNTWFASVLDVLICRAFGGKTQ